MEIRTYLGIIGRYWWIVVLAVIAAAGTVAVLDSVRKPSYTTRARVVVRPAQTITDERTTADIVGQLDNLSIANTYAQTFTSAQVKADTLRALNVSKDQLSGYSLTANRLADTSVIEVSGTGSDPTFLANYVNATVTSAVTQSVNLFKVVEMSVLEPAGVPSRPTSPVPSRDIPTGAALGLIAGILLTLLLDYLFGSSTQASRFRVAGKSKEPNPEANINKGAKAVTAYADWTRPIETIDGPALVSKENQSLATDTSWLPAPRLRRSHTGKKRG